MFLEFLNKYTNSTRHHLLPQSTSNYDKEVCVGQIRCVGIVTYSLWRLSDKQFLKLRVMPAHVLNSLKSCFQCSLSFAHIILLLLYELESSALLMPLLWQTTFTVTKTLKSYKKQNTLNFQYQKRNVTPACLSYEPSIWIIAANWLRTYIIQIKVQAENPCMCYSIKAYSSPTS